LAGLFVVTGSYAGVYRAARLQRAETHYRKGEQLAREKRAAEAAEEYRAALMFSPNDSRYRLALARALINAGRLEEAEAHLISLHDTDPDNALIELLLARVAARQGRVEQAVAQYHQAIYGLWPDDPVGNRLQARFELISLLGQTGQPRQALAEVLVLANEAPDETATQERIANLLLRYGSVQRAGDVFTRVAQKEPGNLAAILGAGEAAFAQGNYPAAANWFRRALRLDGANAEARARLQEADEIDTLDPTRVSLSGAARFERSRVLVEKTLAAIETCLQGRPASAGMQQLAANAHQLLQSSRKHREGDTLKAIALAEQLWEARKQACGKPGAGEEALDLIIAKAAK
jgi:tetratricopeptide (TPR) repeat protein